VWVDRFLNVLKGKQGSSVLEFVAVLSWKGTAVMAGGYCRLVSGSLQQLTLEGRSSKLTRYVDNLKVIYGRKGWVKCNYATHSVFVATPPLYPHSMCN
jgi:hypothetical protein